MAISISEADRTLIEDGQTVLTAATELDLAKLEQIKAAADGSPTGNPNLLFAPVLNSFLNADGEISVMLTGVPLDEGEANQNPVYDALGQRGIQMVGIANAVEGGSPPLVFPTFIVLQFVRPYNVGEFASLQIQALQLGDWITVVDEENLPDVAAINAAIDAEVNTFVMNHDVTPTTGLMHSVSEASLLLFESTPSTTETTLRVWYSKDTVPTAMVEVLDDLTQWPSAVANPSVIVNEELGYIQFTLYSLPQEQE